MREMLRQSSVPLLFVVLLMSLTSTGEAQTPAAVSRDFSHAMSVEGAGTVKISFRSLHWNQPAYLAARDNERVLTNLNRLWRTIGRLETDFDMMVGGKEVKKGSYTMGVSFDAGDNFSLVLIADQTEMVIPMSLSKEGPVVTYLSFDLRPTNNSDAFVIEGRYGNLSASVEVKVPRLAAAPGQN